MSAVGHRVPIDLGFDVDDLLCVGLEPRNVNLDVEVADASQRVVTARTERKKRFRTHLQTMASSGMTSKCAAVIMSLFPVVVTKTLARAAASSMVVTS